MKEYQALIRGVKDYATIKLAEAALADPFAGGLSESINFDVLLPSSSTVGDSGFSSAASLFLTRSTISTSQLKNLLMYAYSMSSRKPTYKSLEQAHKR
jgi:hypothetical protein